MDEQELSGEEKRRRMKEEYKKELRARKEFLDKVNGLRRVQSINKALSDMNVEDDSQEWIDKLNQESAFTEAKVEMAMESARLAEEDAKSEQQKALDEAEMQKLAAEEMVRKMKEEMAAEAGRTLINVEIEDDGTVMEKEVEVEEEDESPRRGMIDLD